MAVFVANEFPIVGVIGDRGSGKTNLMVKLAFDYKTEGLNVYANFKLFGIDYTPITFDDIVDFPEYLENGIILLDEGHTGADAYNFFSRKVKSITDFATQTRKRKLILMYSTQVFTQVAKRLRDLTNYLIETNKTINKGIIYIRVYDRSKIKNGGFINEYYVDGRPFFDKYDTNEIIMDK